MSNGVVTSEPDLKGQAHSPIHKSKIDGLTAHLAGTYRFGEIAPHFVAEVENNDKWPLRCAHNVRSFNLKAPLMSDIYYRKNYFQVPEEAILPLNWDKVYTNPVLGDDVDATEVNTVIDDFPNKLRSYFVKFKSCSEIASFDSSDNTTWMDFLNASLKYFISLEYFCSAGSLPASLGIPLQALLKCNFDIVFDKVFTAFNHICSDTLVTLVTTSANYSVDPRRYIPESSRNELDQYDHVISFGHLLDIIRDDFDWSVAVNDVTDIDVSYLNAINNALGEIVWATDELQNYPEWPFNYKRCAAYQLVCAHYFSNDKIDYVYSAELYRQLFFDAVAQVATVYGSSFLNSTFILNGISYRYDYLSGFYVSRLFTTGLGGVALSDFDCINDCFRLLFGFKRSLRHLDYFSGSKSQPLAVGDSDTNVVGGKVSSIDITRNIQRQRFRNFVNLVGRKFEEYTAKLNGKHVDFDWHNPIVLSKGTSDTIYGSEIENNNINPEALGQPAQSTTAVMRGSANTTAFELEFDRPSIVLGLTWFDIERYYVNSIERQNFHVDRFDMFNEFMQYVGDQPVYRCELTPLGSKSNYFGYALRHAEYKQRVNRCFGGFASGMLPGWEFVADQNADDSSRGHIGPDYIRSRPSELDPFFLSLTGYSRGTYWHFIIDNYNITEPIRPMVVTPQILG